MSALYAAFVAVGEGDILAEIKMLETEESPVANVELVEIEDSPIATAETEDSPVTPCKTTFFVYHTCLNKKSTIVDCVRLLIAIVFRLSIACVIHLEFTVLCTLTTCFVKAKRY